MADFTEPYPIREHLEAYLDIETTGLSRDYDGITIVGVYLFSELKAKCIQLVGDEISAESVLKALEDVDTIYTYNGSRFDLPFIYCLLGIDLTDGFAHHDLMYDCWKANLYGGLKSVEKQLGIKRKLNEVNGYEAVRLWWRYVDNDDATALAKLIKYNREDVINLKILRDMLLQYVA